MPVMLQWAENETVLVVQLSGRLTATELNMMSRGLLEKLSTTEQSIYLLIDFEDVVFYPSLKDFTANAIQALSHPQLGWIAIIGMNAILRLWIGLLRRSAPIRFQAVDSGDAGWQFIHDKKSESQVK